MTGDQRTVLARRVDILERQMRTQRLISLCLVVVALADAIGWWIR